MVQTAAGVELEDLATLLAVVKEFTVPMSTTPDWLQEFLVSVPGATAEVPQTAALPPHPTAPGGPPPMLALGAPPCCSPWAPP